MLSICSQHLYYLVVECCSAYKGVAHRRTSRKLQMYSLTTRTYFNMKQQRCVEKCLNRRKCGKSVINNLAMCNHSLSIILVGLECPSKSISQAMLAYRPYRASSWLFFAIPR